jgi:small-conductance mechanosensitive channel
MGPSFIDRAATEPAWLVLALYAALAGSVALLVARVLKRSLAEVARRSPSHMTEVIAKSAPRPIAFAVFLAEISGGLRWLPLPKTLEALTRHLLPFGLAILAVLLVMRVAQRAIDAFGRSNPALRSSAGLGRSVTWVVGIGLIGLLLCDALGISLAPVLTAFGIGSLAVALALQDTLSNFFSGIALITDKPVRPGDFVRLEAGGQEGYVEAIGSRSTHLRTLGGGVVVVPNATLAKAVLTNFGSSNPRLELRVRLDVALDSDVLHTLSELEAESATFTSIEGVKSEPSPALLFLPAPSPWALRLTVLLHVEPTANFDLVEHESRKRLFLRMKTAGIAPARGHLPEDHVREPEAPSS